MDLLKLFTSPYPAGTYTWNSSSNLTLVSTSGNNATFSASGTGEGWIRILVNGVEVAKRNVWAGTPPQITSITGPSTASVGTFFTYYANPEFPASAGEYEWYISPTQSTEVINYTSGNMCDIKFLYTGTYYVACRSKSSCYSTGSYMSKLVTVTSPGYYSAAVTNNSKIVTVTYSPQGEVSQSARRMVDYTLTNVTTGAAVASGKMPASGGTLDFSNVPTSIYVLRIDTGNGTPETFKVILK